MSAIRSRPGAPRPGGRRPSPPGQPSLPLPEFALTLTISGRDHAVRLGPREPGDHIHKVYSLTPLTPGGCAAEVVEWLDDAPGAADRPGYRNLSCSCPDGRRGHACPHLRALIAFDLVRPASPAESWPGWTDEECWSLAGGA